MVILSLSMLVATGCGMVDMVLIMAGRTSWNLGNAVLALAVNLVLDLLLIPPFGITGAAIGWGVAILFANLVPLSQVRFALHLHPFGRGTKYAMALSAGCYGVIPGVALLLAGPGLSTLIPALVVGTLIWLLRCLHRPQGPRPGQSPRGFAGTPAVGSPLRYPDPR